MPKARWVGMILLGLAITACKDIDTGSCTNDAECGPQGVCQRSVCVRTDLPVLTVATDRSEARIGETVLVDASASWSRTGGHLSFSFAVEPEGAASIIVGEDVPGVAWFTVEKPHLDFDVVVEAIDRNDNRSIERRTIVSQDSPPIVDWSFAPEPFQPGDVVTITLAAMDPDGDVLAFDWSLEGSWGSLIGDGPTAQLHTVPHREDIIYRVSASVSARGIEVTRAVDLSGRNRAPEIIPFAEPAADHACEAGLGCLSRIPLIETIDDVGDVRADARILSGPPDVTVVLEANGSGGFDAITSCRPVCPIAGDYRIEVTATDTEGLVSTREIGARVRNRPPVLQVHDGGALPHAWHPPGLFRVERPAGTVLVWSDPDGDPPDLSTIRWSASSSVVDFSDPASIDPSIVAIGTKEQLQDLTITLLAADINGAEAADTRPLPVGNRPPSIYFAGEESEGHEYVGVAGDGQPILRKAFLVPVEDRDGDPIELRVRPPYPTPAGMRVYEESGTWYLEVEGASFLGQSVRISVEAGDAWGDWSEASGLVRISNREPVITMTPSAIKTGSGCSRQSCCLEWVGAACVRQASAMVFTAFDTQGPALFDQKLLVRDPDGDPVRVTLTPSSLSKGYAFFSDTRTQETEFTSPKELVCTGSSAATLTCSYQVRFYGRADNGGACRIETGSPAAVLSLQATLDDGMGASPGVGFVLSTAAGGTCQ